MLWFVSFDFKSRKRMHDLNRTMVAMINQNYLCSTCTENCFFYRLNNHEISNYVGPKIKKKALKKASCFYISIPHYLFSYSAYLKVYNRFSFFLVPRVIKELSETIIDLKLDNISVSCNEANIPFVHPRMKESLFYGTFEAKKPEAYKPSSKYSEKNPGLNQGKSIVFEDLINEKYCSKYIGLIGYPGSGKTVLSKRLANASKLATFFLRFMDINYDSDYKLTLRELLFDNMFPNLSENECAEAFEWITKNDNQCAIIIDGYDQAEWTMTKNPAKMSLNSKLIISDLVSNLCTKHFLPRSTIIITSRPHSMITLPTELRPDITIMLQDFSFETMKKLLFALAGSSAESIWSALNINAPQLLSLCQNPLMLVFVLRAFMNSSGDVSNITSMTSAFTKVLEDLRSSSHSRHDDIHTIVEQIARIAFARTQCHSVVITTKDLEKENLSVSVVQDLIIAIYGGKGGSKVFDGDTKLFFSHQTLQEYFAALYIAKEMSYAKFKEFVYADLFRPHWDVVRRFLCGILMNSKSGKFNLLVIKFHFFPSLE